MAAIKVQTGSKIKVRSDGRIGTVSGLIPVKTGGRGRPATKVVVTHDDGVNEYSLKELRLI